MLKIWGILLFVVESKFMGNTRLLKTMAQLKIWGKGEVQMSRKLSQLLVNGLTLSVLEVILFKIGVKILPCSWYLEPDHEIQVRLKFQVIFSTILKKEFLL